jgi:predicted N-acetyltransferase YhbS
MQSKVIVRRAAPHDAQVIEALYQQLVSNPAVSVSPERIRQVSQDPHTALFVGELDGVVVGTALVSLCADVMFQSQPFAVVENIIVDSSSRNTGIGGVLMGEIESFCLNAECSKIMLLSSIDRIQAHRFFEREGYSASFKHGFVKYRRQLKRVP